MFPIRDHNPSLRTPWVTYGLIAANILVFLAYWPLFNEPRALQAFFLEWGLIPVKVAGGDGVYPLFTSMFLHGGVLHIAGNMLFLWIFGDNLEDVFGHLGFALFYLASGVGAGLLHLAADPASPVPTVGASGAIAGVMGGYLLLFPRARVDVLIIIFFFIRILALPAWVMLGLWFGFQLVNGLAADTQSGGVAYWAHAGGFVVGLAFTLPVWFRRGGPAYWQRTHGLPPYPEGRYRIRRTDVPRAGHRRRPGRGPWGR
ncbi:rhomboid family intramembrane serine protease [Rhodovulum sp. YNF3179]|uniref:rhomboid family intramembrane serine protease n=1 Tax=Rhodovulum sp. YNF3179 TaxID=3425127 RepID=UPI003D332020